METITLKHTHNFNALIERFCKDCKLRGMTNESIRRYKSSLNQFVDFFPDSNLIDVDMQMLKEFLGYLKYERGLKHKTIENDFTALSAFYDFLAFDGFDVKNLVLPFRKRYLRMYKNDYNDPKKKLLTIEEMSQLANSILDPRDKAITLVLAKTGVRRGELLKMDLDDINWDDYSIILKPVAKRSNRLVFFDDECALALKRWLKVREKLNPKTRALFISYQTLNRLSRNAAYQAVVKYARRLGFHNSDSPRLEDHFGPHCFRHWFTTWLLRNGMPREYVKELRGDKRKEAIDIYHHIDKDELRKTYLACIPKLCI
jgi:integrase/recombinase XerD